MIGANISQKVVKRIKNNEYVDFCDLLPLNDYKSPDELTLTLDPNNKPLFVKKQ